MKRTACIFIVCAMLLGLCGCVRTAPVLHPEVTPASTPAPTIAPTPEPTPTATLPPLEVSTITSNYDALGEYISDADHFTRYLTFRNIQVYEQCEDTFLDAVVENSYPNTIVCAIDVVFSGEDATKIAEASLQTRDGAYVLRLAPGETTLLAQIDTDTVLTDQEFELVFNETLGVLPE